MRSGYGTPLRLLIYTHTFPYVRAEPAGKLLVTVATPLLPLLKKMVCGASGFADLKV